MATVKSATKSRPDPEKVKQWKMRRKIVEKILKDYQRQMDEKIKNELDKIGKEISKW